MCRLRRPVVKVFLAFLFTLMVGASIFGGSAAMAQSPATEASVTQASQADRIAALEKQNADNTAAIAAAQTAGDN
ncbi:MAG: ammonia channel protein, partial [Edaphobacter sp.]